jgi:hypothetical protein
MFKCQYIIILIKLNSVFVFRHKQETKGKLCDDDDVSYLRSTEVSSDFLRSPCHLVDSRLSYSAVRELAQQPRFMLTRSGRVTANPRCVYTRSVSLLIKRSVKMNHGC